jgi:lipopolysaccharide/colanic/teichoic acid biosynthesis glycosyltransferase
LRSRGVCVVRPVYDQAKRTIDIAVCVAALPIVAVVLVVCAALIWMEDGRPVFFTQWRTGRSGRRFRMLKLRTMVRDAHTKKDLLREKSLLSWPDFKLDCDPRVTRVGKVLRRTSLDELPQVFNVLRGEMSLVGPRPTSFAAETYALSQTERLEVAPGLTGLWQVCGRSDLEFDQRVALDVEYIERRGIYLDLQILWHTLRAIAGGRGAY